MFGSNAFANITTTENARYDSNSLPTHRREAMSAVRELHLRDRDGLHHERRQPLSIHDGQLLFDLPELINLHPPPGGIDLDERARDEGRNLRRSDA
jgi:hypothetical protein